MAWTAPRTWVTSEVVTAALLNTHLRDNLLWAGFHHGCRAYKSANQTVGIGATDLVTWNSESYDTDGFHSTSSNTGRFVATVAGYYEVSFEPAVDADASHHNGRYITSLRKNAAGASGGGTSLESASFAGHSFTQAGIVHWSGFLSAADYVEAFFNSTTEARDVIGGEDFTNLEFKFLGF
jgi:hypothetical protein